jgi:uncharacterized protein (TIGR04222 family)
MGALLGAGCGLSSVAALDGPSLFTLYVIAWMFSLVLAQGLEQRALARPGPEPDVDELDRYELALLADWGERGVVQAALVELLALQACRSRGETKPLELLHRPAPTAHPAVRKLFGLLATTDIVPRSLLHSKSEPSVVARDLSTLPLRALS